jgi:hypothetical protein
MFLIFPFHPLCCVGAISDAESLRATARQSMKWLTELRYEAAMNHSCEFIVAKRNRVQRSYRLNTVQQAGRDKCIESCRRTFAARSDRQTISRCREAWDVVPIVCAAGKNIVAIVHPTINALCLCGMTERASLFSAGTRQSGAAVPSS